MPLNAGTVEIDVRGDLTPLRRDLTSVNAMAASAGKTTGAQFASGLATQKSKIAGVGSTLRSAFLLAGGIAAARGIKTFTFDAAQEARKIGVQTEAVLKSTGNAAGVTANEISKLAQTISEYSAIDDEAIQEGENLLLTFKNIRNEAGQGNDIFDQSTKILTDMSVAMKTDVSSGAIQLGKALNDPVKGISALTRVGVTFSEEQKKVIEQLVKTGDTAGAQKIILQELKSEFGGSARAAGKVDPYGKLRVKLENIGETIGASTLPALDAMAEGLIDTLKGTNSVQDSIGALAASLTANDTAVDGNSKLIAAYGKQLQAGVISVDEYNERTSRQIALTREIADAHPDVISLQEELAYQVAISEAAVRRYNSALAQNRVNFQQADAAASDYMNTVGAAPSVQFADSQAGGVPPSGGSGRNGGNGGGSGGGSGGGVYPFSQVELKLDGKTITRTVNLTERKTKILLGTD